MSNKIFSIGRFVIQVGIATSQFPMWVLVDRDGDRHTQYIAISTVAREDVGTSLAIVVGPLGIMIGIV